MTFPGTMLARGFWLYVWSVTTPGGRNVLYVGRTGDNSSPNASPPYVRMGQHLGSVKTQNALRRHLANRQIAPESCEFVFVAHGPIYPEASKPVGFVHSDEKARRTLMDFHLPVRNIVGALEKKLAESLGAAGYEVLNRVSWRHPITLGTWPSVREAFEVEFPKLASID